jgi:uncharacterized protein (TIGR02099 family)
VSLRTDLAFGAEAKRQTMTSTQEAPDTLDAAIEAQLAPNERRWLKWLRRAGWALVAMYILIAAGMLALRFWLLPTVADHKERIAAAVSSALGERVEIGTVEAEWLGLRPRLELTDVRIFDRRGEEALALPYVGVAVAWSSLVTGELRFKSILLDRPDLSIRRDPQGKIYIAGLELKPNTAPDGSAADWLLKQGEIVIRDGTVEWSDEYRRASPIRLERVGFLLQNDGRHHRFAIRAAPPQELASAIDLRGDLIGRTIDQLGEWNGRLYAAFDYVDLAGWQTWVDYPVEVRGGRGALKLWLGFADKSLTELAADVALADVATRLAPELPLAEVRDVRGQFGAKKTLRFELIDLDGVPDIAYDAFARQLALVMKSGTALAPADFIAHWEPAQGGSRARGELVARSIELAPLALVGEYLPFPEAARKTLAALSPEGRLADVNFTWTGEIEQPTTYAARGKFADLGMRPYERVPGFSRLSGTFDVNDRSGNVTLASKAVAVEYPKILLEERLSFESISARVGWSFPQGGLQLRLDDVAFSNADLAGTLSGSYRSDGKGMKGLDLTARVSRAEGKSVYKYIPFLPPSVATWLKDGIQSGAVGETRVRFRGDPRDFPFSDPKKGEFRISGRVTGGTLEYAAGWPKLTNVTADILFDGPRLKITSARTNALGAQISSAIVAFPDLYAPGRTDLVADGEAQGPAGEFLRFIAQSPVREALDGLTDRWTAEGRASLKVHLELPLEHLERTKLAGTFQFANNGLGMGPGEPALTQVNGRVDFTESGASARNLTAHALGGAINAQVTTRDGVITALVQGNVDVSQLARQLELPIADRLRGTMPFRYTSTTARQRPSSSVFESSLVGVAVDLPAPFSKAAADSAPLRMERSAIPDEAEGAKNVRRDRIAVTVGKLIDAQAQVRSEGGRVTIERAAVGIGDLGVALPERPGVFISGNLKTLDLDRLLPTLTAAGEKAGTTDFSITALSLRAGELVAGGRLFHDITVRAQFDSRKTWRADVNAREVAGEIEWRAEGQGALRAQLKHLVHPEAAPGATDSDGVVNELPALRLVADRYTFNGHELGRLELRAVNEQKGWRLAQLELAAPDGTVTASGLWQPPRLGAERTELDVKMDVKDVGTYLARLGYGDTVAKGTATLEGAVQWSGPVYRIDYGSLGGHLALKAAKGQFVKVDPGVGKLLGVLSLQSLPRRVSLDFRDVFSDGFAFDSITGSAKIARGVATTDNLAMAGPAASVAITGQADLAKETQDLSVRVVPTIGDGVALAAGVALLNPIVGAGALLAQRLFKDPLGQMLAFEYHVSGSWEDPKVIKVRAPSPQQVEGELGAPKTEESK